MKKIDWKPWYAALKNANPDIYRMAIESAEGAHLNHGLTTPVAADIERAMVMLACHALDVRP